MKLWKHILLVIVQDNVHMLHKLSGYACKSLCKPYVIFMNAMWFLIWSNYLFCLIGCFCTNWWVKVLLLAFDSSKIIDITIRLRSKVNIDLSHHHYIFLKNDWFYFFVNRFLAYFVEWYANYMLFPKWLLCSVSIFQEMTCVLHMQLCMEFILHASLKLWKFAMSKHFELDHFWKCINTLNLNSRNWYPNMNRSTL